MPVAPTGNTPRHMDLDFLPAATGSIIPHTGSAQNTSSLAATTFNFPIDRNDPETPDLYSLTRSAAVPTLSAKGSLIRNPPNCAMSSDGDSSRAKASHLTAANTHEILAEHQASLDAAHATKAPDVKTNASQYGQAPADALIEQRVEGRLVLEGEYVKSEAEQIPELLVHNGLADDRSLHEDDTMAGPHTNMTLKASTTHTKSQSSSTPASEPASPRPAPELTPQEITLAELKVQKAAMLASLVALPAVQVLIEESHTSDVDMSDDDGEPTETDIMTAANKMVKEHIKLLHEYNELKDVGQGLMGLIADQRGVRIVEVQDEFGLDAND
jgi:Swi5